MRRSEAELVADRVRGDAKHPPNLFLNVRERDELAHYCKNRIAALDRSVGVVSSRKLDRASLGERRRMVVLLEKLIAMTWLNAPAPVVPDVTKADRDEARRRWEAMWSDFYPTSSRSSTKGARS